MSAFHPNTYQLEFWEGNALRTMLYFGELYSAKKFFDEVVQERKFKWKTPMRVVSPQLKWPSGEIINICSEDLEKILSYEYTPSERKWQLPQPYLGFAQRVRGGERVATPRNTHADAENASAPSSRKRSDTPAPTPRRKTMGSAARVSLADICDANDIDPRKARAILRKRKTAKPYEWEEDDVASVVKLLKKELS